MGLLPGYHNIFHQISLGVSCVLDMCLVLHSIIIYNLMLPSSFESKMLIQCFRHLLQILMKLWSCCCCRCFASNCSEIFVYWSLWFPCCSNIVSSNSAFCGYVISMNLFGRLPNRWHQSFLLNLAMKVEDRIIDWCLVIKYRSPA